MLEWALRKKGIPEVLARSLWSLYEGARARVRVDSELSEESVVNVGMHRACCHLFFHIGGRCCHRMCQ